VLIEVRSGHPIALQEFLAPDWDVVLLGRLRPLAKMVRVRLFGRPCVSLIFAGETNRLTGLGDNVEGLKLLRGGWPTCQAE
jgi:hypothetical protein